MNFIRPEAPCLFASPTTRSGAGLGLAIAARAVRLHHGSLQARNLPGGGLEVTLRLPAV